MFVDPSPFPHQGPLEPDQVRGRDELIDDLVARLTGRRVTALLGPRRFGKTSVLRRVAAELAQGGAGVIWIDLYEATSIADIARRFDTGLAGAFGPVRSTLDSVALGFDLQLGLLGIDRVDGATGRLRTKLQHHFQEVGLVFAGSQPSLMRTMFAERSRPFYAQVDLVEIGAFSSAAVHDIVHDGFAVTQRQAADTPGRIFDLTGGHPYRTMQVADVAWRAVPPGARATAETWSTTIAMLRNETHMACEATFSGLGAAEKTTMRLLAHGDPLFGTAAETLSLSTGGARHATDTLVASGDVIESNGYRSIVNPVLADWIRRRFPR